MLNVNFTTYNNDDDDDDDDDYDDDDFGLCFPDVCYCLQHAACGLCDAIRDSTTSYVTSFRLTKSASYDTVSYHITFISLAYWRS